MKFQDDRTINIGSNPLRYTLSVNILSTMRFFVVTYYVLYVKICVLGGTKSVKMMGFVVLRLVI